jgi:hypothetical protein
MHEVHVAPSAAHADIVVSGEESLPRAVDRLAACVLRLAGI